MLDQNTLKTRIDAARTLRGMTQEKLGELLEADGLGKHDLGRIERGKITMQAVHRHALVRHLQVPEAWFTEEELDLTAGPAIEAGDLGGQVARLADYVETVVNRIDAAMSVANHNNQLLRTITDHIDQAESRVAGRVEEIVVLLSHNKDTLDGLHTLEMDWRNATRSITQLAEGLLPADDQGDEAAARTPGASDATGEARRARGAGNS